MAASKITEIRLSQYIRNGGPSPDCFEICQAKADTSPLEHGEVRYRVLSFGLNSGMANRMGAGDSASASMMEIGEVPKCEAVVKITETASDDFQTDCRALYRWAPWRSAGKVSADDLLPIPDAEQDLDPEVHLTILGHVGFTAYVGLITIGHLKPDDSVFISAGAGGVGSSAVQIAKALGATVIACAGSDEKVDLLRDLGADVALNYKTEPLEDQLKSCGQPFNVYFDLVGGKPLQAAIETIDCHGRIIICGTASQYSSSASNTGIPNYPRMIYKELTMRGFASPQHEDALPEFNRTVGGWLREGKVRPVATMRDGMDAMPKAFADMIGGANLGRMLVRVSEGNAPA